MPTLRVFLVVPNLGQLGVIQQALSGQDEITVCGTQTSLDGLEQRATDARTDLVCVARELAEDPEFHILKRHLHRKGIFSMYLRQCGSCPHIGLSDHRHCGQSKCTTVAGDIWGLVARMIRVVDERQPPPPPPHPVFAEKRTRMRIILIGASTGGVDALETILSHYPARCPPTAIVQHTGAAFGESLTRYLDSRCAAKVREAKQGDQLVPGTIYVAASSAHHLEFRGRERLSVTLREGPRISGHRPSIDAMFLSAEKHAPDIVATLLTGMGRDGANGLLALRKAGATTFAQDEDSSVVYGMPRVAWEIGAASKRLNIKQMGPALLSAATKPVGSSQTG